MPVTINERRFNTMVRQPVCFNVFELQQLTFTDEPDLESACRAMQDKVYALSAQFAALLDRVNASRRITLSNQRNAAVDKVKAIEAQLDAHIRGKVFVTNAYDEAARRHSTAQQRCRSLKNNPPNSSRMSDAQLAQHEQTVEIADRELAAASDELTRAQVGVNAWVNGEATLQQQLAQAQSEVAAISGNVGGWTAPPAMALSRPIRQPAWVRL